MAEQSFFHSFPRARGANPDAQAQKGLEILRLILDVGLVLAPEIVTWRMPQQDGTERLIQVKQCRICFTELAADELPNHAEQFGPFAIEFQPDVLRQLGAVPVIYMPQTVGGDRKLSSVGSVVVAMVGHLKYTMDELEGLRRCSDEAEVLKDNPRADSVAPDAKLKLRNVDENEQVVHEYEVPMSAARDLLSYVGFKNAPFDLLSGVLGYLQSLFYPTDDLIHDELLAYYRQREWRLIPGVATGDVVHGRDLTNAEKQRLIAIDEDFWTRVLEFKEEVVTRVDAAKIIDHSGAQPLIELISAVIAPEAYRAEVEAIVGGRVPIRH